MAYQLPYLRENSSYRIKIQQNIADTNIAGKLFVLGLSHGIETMMSLFNTKQTETELDTTQTSYTIDFTTKLGSGANFDYALAFLKTTVKNEELTLTSTSRKYTANHPKLWYRNTTNLPFYDDHVELDGSVSFDDGRIPYQPDNYNYPHYEISSIDTVPVVLEPGGYPYYHIEYDDFDVYGKKSETYEIPGLSKDTTYSITIFQDVGNANNMQGNLMVLGLQRITDTIWELVPNSVSDYPTQIPINNSKSHYSITFTTGDNNSSNTFNYALGFKTGSQSAILTNTGRMYPFENEQPTNVWNRSSSDDNPESATTTVRYDKENHNPFIFPHYILTKLSGT